MAAKRPNWPGWMQKVADELATRLGPFFIRHEKFIQLHYKRIRLLGFIKHWENIQRHWESNRRTQLGTRERHIYDYLKKQSGLWIDVSTLAFDWHRKNGVGIINRRKEIDNTRKALSRLRSRGLVETKRKGKERGRLRAHFIEWVARIVVDEDDKPIKVDPLK